MNQSEIAQIVDELRRKHPESTGAADLSDFELTLSLLPQGVVWRVADLTPSVCALAPGDALFTITLGEAPEPELPRAATLSSRRVETEELLAELEWGDYLRLTGNERWRRTHWTFRFPGQDSDQLEQWQRITGQVRTSPAPQEVDRDEWFARGLLARIRRPAGDGGESAGVDRGPLEQAPAEPSPSRGERVTDIWGNPLDKRGRRRR